MSAPEELPVIPLDLGGQPFEATPYNLELFTFSPFARLWDGREVPNPEAYNHAFATYTEDGERKTGAYIMAEETVQRLGAIILNYGFPARLNQMTIQECDYDARQKFIEQQIEEVDDFFPDDWAEGDSM